MRVFIAFKPSLKIREKIFETANQLSDVCEMKQVELENIHLTLFFWKDLGDFEVKSIPDLLNDFSFNAFEITIHKLKVFYRKNFPSVVNFPVKSHELLKMKEQLNEIFSLNHIEFEQKRFIPHFTLLRIKNINKLNFFKRKIYLINDNLKKISFCLDSITLYESILKKTGPEYNILYHKKLVSKSEDNVNG